MKNETKEFILACCEAIAKEFEKYQAKKTRNFKEGDIVFSTAYGKGKVKDITKGTYPIWVVFDDSDEVFTYTQDGKNFSYEKFPILFHYDTYKEDIKKEFNIN
ncbi:MAG: hypothetical protein M9897_06350 [Brumimicrobium sp.]|nr:hypothetical protein [Brumimicrobium sp.]